MLRRPAVAAASRAGVRLAPFPAVAGLRARLAPLPAVAAVTRPPRPLPPTLHSLAAALAKLGPSRASNLNAVERGALDAWARARSAPPSPPTKTQRPALRDMTIFVIGYGVSSTVCVMAEGSLGFNVVDSIGLQYLVAVPTLLALYRIFRPFPVAQPRLPREASSSEQLAEDDTTAPVVLRLIGGFQHWRWSAGRFLLLALPAVALASYFLADCPEAEAAVFAGLLGSGPTEFTYITVHPVAEEIILRGLLFGRMLLTLGAAPAYMAAAASPLLRRGQSADPVDLAWPVFTNVLLAAAYHATGSLWVPVALHLGYNLVAVHMFEGLSPFFSPVRFGRPTCYGSLEPGLRASRRRQMEAMFAVRRFRDSLFAAISSMPASLGLPVSGRDLLDGGQLNAASAAAVDKLFDLLRLRAAPTDPESFEQCELERVAGLGGSRDLLVGLLVGAEREQEVARHALTWELASEMRHDMAEERRKLEVAGVPQDEMQAELSKLVAPDASGKSSLFAKYEPVLAAAEVFYRGDLRLSMMCDGLSDGFGALSRERLHAYVRRMALLQPERARQLLKFADWKTSTFPTVPHLP